PRHRGEMLSRAVCVPRIDHDEFERTHGKILCAPAAEGDAKALEEPATGEDDGEPALRRSRALDAKVPEVDALREIRFERQRTGGCLSGNKVRVPPATRLTQTIDLERPESVGMDLEP